MKYPRHNIVGYTNFKKKQLHAFLNKSYLHRIFFVLKKLHGLNATVNTTKNKNLLDFFNYKIPEKAIKGKSIFQSIYGANPCLPNVKCKNRPVKRKGAKAFLKKKIILSDASASSIFDWK